MTYATTTSDTAATATSATTATAAATGALAAFIATGTLAAAGSTFLGLRGLGLASQLHRNLAREDLLAGEFLNSGAGLVGSGEIHKGVANGAVGAGVHRDRGALAASLRLVIEL
jgi:hypothetical protein